MSMLSLASIPFVLKLESMTISFGKVQNSEWMLEFTWRYFFNKKVCFVLKRLCGNTTAFATLTIFKPYHFAGIHTSVWKIPFAVGQLQSDELHWGVIGAGPTNIEIEANGVFSLYEVDTPESCFKSVDDTLTTISIPYYSAQHLQDLTSLLDTDPQGLSDAVLKCAGEKIPVHKCILAARSPVFAAMFTSDMEEARSNVADIQDVDPNIMRKVLKFIYSGKIEDLSEAMLGDLLYAAEKYGLAELKTICVDKLRSGLTVDNVFDVLVLGELHDESLKAHAKRYICEHRDFSKLEETPQWQLLVKDRPGLAIEVVTASVKYKEELMEKINSSVSVEKIVNFVI